MRILKTLLALALCLALALPCAAAESAAYVPGETMGNIIADVWNSGKLINADMSMIFEANAEAFGLSAEDAAEFDAITALLDQATLRVGAGRLDDGLRIELTGLLDAQEGAQDVEVRMGYDLTREGLTIDSSLFEGRKLAMTWEEFLAMCDVDDQTIAAIMSLVRGETTLESMLSELMAQLEPVIALCGQLLTPYAETAGAWAQTLYVEQLTNVAATEDYPAAATVTNIYVTDKDLGDLITKLATQLKADPTTCALLDGILAQANDGEPVSTALLCDELLARAADMTDEENPLVLTAAFDANGTPLYFELFNLEPNGQSEYAGAFFYPQADDPNTYNYDLSVYALTSTGNVHGGLSFYGTVTVDPQDLAATDVVMNFACVEDGEAIMGMEYTVSVAPKATADGLPGYAGELAMSMSGADGEDTVQMLMNGTTQTGLTKQGGEQSDVTMNVDVYAGGQGLSMTVLGGMIIEPCESGLTGSYSVIESMPAAGLERYGFQMVFSSEDLAPSTLPVVDMAAMTDEDLEALADEVEASVEALVEQAKQAIPADTLEMLMEISE